MIGMTPCFRMKCEPVVLQDWNTYDRWSEIDQIKLLTAVDDRLRDDAVLKATLGPYLRSEPLGKACKDLQTIMDASDVRSPHNDADLAALAHLARWGPFISDVLDRIGDKGGNKSTEAEAFIEDILARMTPVETGNTIEIIPAFRRALKSPEKAS